MNKIGINEYKLRDVEKKIVNLKLNLLDETFNFNEKKFNLEYLKKLNDFLFQDFYFENELGYRYKDSIELLIIKDILIEIEKTCLQNPENIDAIIKLVHDIWYLQPFMVGNTRTMIAFLKIISSSYLLDLEVNINGEISSTPLVFKKGNIVNQKRLTTKK